MSWKTFAYVEDDTYLQWYTLNIVFKSLTGLNSMKTLWWRYCSWHPIWTLSIWPSSAVRGGVVVFSFQPWFFISKSLLDDGISSLSDEQMPPEPVDFPFTPWMRNPPDRKYHDSCWWSRTASQDNQIRAYHHLPLPEHAHPNPLLTPNWPYGAEVRLCRSRCHFNPLAILGKLWS